MRRLTQFWPWALIALLFLPLVWQLLSIQLRLSRNGAIAARLVESLRSQFPGADIRGAASYEKEVVFISVLSGLDPGKRSEIEQSLRKLKADEAIAPAIWLRFFEKNGEENEVRF